MYERFVNQLKEYSCAIRILLKGYLPISLLPPSKLTKILQVVKQVLLKTNKNYLEVKLVISGTVHWFDLKTSFHPQLWTSSGLKGTWKTK